MKGLRPITTVQDLKNYLDHCPPDAEILLMPEDGDGMRIAGVLHFETERPQQVWLLFDEFTDADESPSKEWVGGPSDDDDIPFSTVQGAERPGDMATAMACDVDTPDVVKVRGKLRTA